MKRHATLTLVLRSVLIVGIVLGVAGLTLATWSDRVTSVDNTFATGDMNLQLCELGSLDWVEGPVFATWHAENMYPGQTLNGGRVYFKNAGSIKGATFDIQVDNECTVPEMDRYIQITQMVYENGITHYPLNPADPFHLTDVNHNGWFDLDDLENDPCLGLPSPMTEGSLTMFYRFNENAGNAFQAASVVADFTFTLHQ
ncbi:MAG: SipW-dependent-type signal peptide-containing protein [Coriobacteriia bacterium]